MTISLKSFVQTGLFIASLTAVGHPASAQSSPHRPLYLAGAVLCTDGSTRLYSGDAPSDLVMQMLCMTPQDPAEQAWQAAATKPADTGWFGQVRVALDNGLEAAKSFANAHPSWVIYALLFLFYVLVPEKSRKGRR